MRRLLVVLGLVVASWPASASALTVRDIVELSRAGLGEEILLALIEVDPSVFPIDAATLKSLKAAGVSERVIVAMVRSARPVPLPLDAVPTQDFLPAPEAATQPTAPAPQVVVIEHQEQTPQVREVAVPVYIPVEGHSRGRHDRDNDGQDTDRDKHHKPAADPVYWGFGGKLRPDAWKPK